MDTLRALLTLVFPLPNAPELALLAFLVLTALVVQESRDRHR